MRVTTPRIVQPGEGSRTWLWLLILVALGAWSWQVFEFGRQQAGFSVTQRNAVEASLEQRIATLEAERDALRTAAARFERAGQIDRAAADGVQAEVRALQDERAELRREVALLTSLVSGEEYTLAFSDFSLSEQGERAYRLDVTLSKGTDKDGAVQGEAVFRVKGRANGAAKTLDMKTLTEGRRSRIGIKFKNFQKLSAELKLPDGFEPQSIIITVKPGSKGFRAFEQAFDWQVSDA